MPVDSPPPTTPESQATHIENPIKPNGDLPAGSPYVDIAAAAYRPADRPPIKDAVMRPGTDKPSFSKVADEPSPAVKGDIDALLKDAPQDVTSGKWSDKTREEWKKLTNDLKAQGLDNDDVVLGLNSVGTALNKILKTQGVDNHVGIAAGPGPGNTSDVYMLINGPSISQTQHALDIMTGHESDTVVKAGEFSPGQPT